jgi:hypothetical protein
MTVCPPSISVSTCSSRATAYGWPSMMAVCAAPHCSCLVCQGAKITGIYSLSLAAGAFAAALVALGLTT